MAERRWAEAHEIPACVLPVVRRWLMVNWVVLADYPKSSGVLIMHPSVVLDTNLGCAVDRNS